MRRLRQRVWEAANVRLSAVVLDTDTTVHTLFGNQMGARKGYNPKNKGIASKRRLEYELNWSELGSRATPTSCPSYR
jgi:hypothetical protein